MTQPSLDDRFRAAQGLADHGTWRPRTPLAARLRELADFADTLPDADVAWDAYGEHGPLARVEQETAQLLGHEDAAYFPSGIMAQQVALRIWADRMGSRRVALPDLSHLVVHEEDGPRLLHDLEYVWLTTGARTPTAADVEGLPGELAAVLVELPLRDGGYLLPSWDELTALADVCRERGMPLHVDGARIWESVAYFDRPLDEIGALADSIYVSFYKGLGGLSGAALAGPKDVVDEARLWRRRLGGTVWTAAPHALSALQGVREVLPQMSRLRDFAVALADALHEQGVRTTPGEPVTNAFRIFLPGRRDDIREQVVRRLEDEHLALPFGWRETEVPGWCMAELTVTPEILGEDPTALAEQIAALAG